MDDAKLQTLIDELREAMHSKRQAIISNNIHLFFVNVCEIVCSLTELGLTDKRSITIEEEYWFEGSRYVSDWDNTLEETYYKPIVNEVRRRNYFRG